MALSGGTIATGQTICYNGNPAAFTSVADASGGVTGYTYQWQYSTDSGSTWNDISGAGSTTYDSGTLTATRWFRRRVIDSDSPASTGYSNTLVVTVYPVLGAGSIASAQTICFNDTPALLTSTAAASGASGSYVYQWQYSTNGVSYSNIAGATSATYQPPALTVNTYYKRRVYDTFCGIGGADYSNVILITVYADDFDAGIIGDAQTIDYGTAPTQLYFITSPSGSSGQYSYQWRSGTTSSADDFIVGATGTTFQPPTLNADTWYKCLITDTYCSKTANTLTIKITVTPAAITTLIFTGGTNNVSIPNKSLIEYLVVGGGGSGGDGNGLGGGGGGGAGGMLTGITIIKNGGNYSVTVGHGGVRIGTTTQRNGGFSRFIGGLINIFATGGGRGACGPCQRGDNGGSGGGAGGGFYQQYGGTGIAGQGYKGGDTISNNVGGAGGGGAGGVGNSAGYSPTGGAGGIGLSSSITGIATIYASGGTGGNRTGSSAGETGIPNTGCGGGGGDIGGLGGFGGSGIVVLKYFDISYFYPVGLVASNTDCATTRLDWTPALTGGTQKIEIYNGGVWELIESGITSGTTYKEDIPLNPNTVNILRVCNVYNSIDYCSDSVTATTITISAPSGLTVTQISNTKVQLNWVNTSTGATELSVYRCITGNCEYIAYLPMSATTFTDTGLTIGIEYTYTIIAECHSYGYGSNVVNITLLLTYVPPFCQGTYYNISDSTCGNSNGKITITDLDYFIFYDFTLTDIWGNSYTFNTTTGEATGLTSGYYFFTATVKPEYWYYYGRETCTFDWIKIEDSDNPAFLVGVSVKPQQCQPFDRQFGRIFYNVSGLTSGHTYSFYAFTSDFSLYYSETGITSTNSFILANADSGCYWVLIRDEISGCAVLIDNRCVPSLNLFSQGGIKKLFIAKWTDDLDYNYWSTADEDYFLEFEDTSFFTSTKIKEYFSASGGTGCTWYSLPVFENVCKLSQKLDKVRQGYIFTDTLTLAVNHATAMKWEKMRNVLNPENKWIFILLDENNFWWTGGYRHGARITVYKFQSGARGEDNGYSLEIQAVSENKILTAIDENYINTKILD